MIKTYQSLSTGCSAPLVLDGGEDLKLISLKVDGKELKVCGSSNCSQWV